MKRSMVICLIGTLVFSSFKPAATQARTDRTTQQRLMAKTWKESGKDGLEMQIVFTRDSMKYNFVGNPAYAGLDCQIAYYLSDEMEQTFDPDKVGKAKNGIYIIQERPIKPKVNIYRIIDIDKNALTCESYFDRGSRIIIYQAVD